MLRLIYKRPIVIYLTLLVRSPKQSDTKPNANSPGISIDRLSLLGFSIDRLPLLGDGLLVSKPEKETQRNSTQNFLLVTSC